MLKHHSQIRSRQMKLILTLQASSYSMGRGSSSFPWCWRIEGEAPSESCLIAAYYDLKEGVNLSVSCMEKGLTHATIYDQRHTHLARKAKAVFLAAELGGQNAIVHSYGKLEGDKSTMREKAVYAARGEQAPSTSSATSTISAKRRMPRSISRAHWPIQPRRFQRHIEFQEGMQRICRR